VDERTLISSLVSRPTRVGGAYTTADRGKNDATVDGTKTCVRSSFVIITGRRIKRVKIIAITSNSRVNNVIILTTAFDLL